MLTGVWLGNLQERDHFEDPGLDGRKILKLAFQERKSDGEVWLRKVAGSYETLKETQGSIKFREFLDYLLRDPVHRVSCVKNQCFVR
jgi:hypothetical protein